MDGRNHHCWLVFAGESSETRVSERWCAKDFATIHRVQPLKSLGPSSELRPRLLQLAGPGDLGAADAGGAGLDGRPAGGALGAQRARRWDGTGWRGWVGGGRGGDI